MTFIEQTIANLRERTMLVPSLAIAPGVSCECAGRSLTTTFTRSARHLNPVVSAHRVQTKQKSSLRHATARGLYRSEPHGPWTACPDAQGHHGHAAWLAADCSNVCHPAAESHLLPAPSAGAACCERSRGLWRPDGGHLPALYAACEEGSSCRGAERRGTAGVVPCRRLLVCGPMSRPSRDRHGWGSRGSNSACCRRDRSRCGDRRRWKEQQRRSV